MEDDPSVTDVAKARYCQLAPPLRLNSDPISRKKDFTSWTSTISLMNTLLRVYPLNTEEQLKWSDHPLVVGLGSVDSIIKIILWIVKGLGRPKKNSSIKVLLRKYNADIIMVQEPKKHRVDEMCLCSFWSGRNIDYVFSPAEGSAGGMVMVGTLICSRFGMLKSVFSLSLSHLSLRLLNRNSQFSWWLCCIYGPSKYKEKEEFWIELNDLGNLVDRPCCVVRDFNEVLCLEDRNRAAAATSQLANFHVEISEFTLINLPLPHTHLTWSNFHSIATCSKLDSVFIPIVA